MKQCTVLFVNPDQKELSHPEYLRSLGFLVHETDQWPHDRDLRLYHVVVLRVANIDDAPMLAARLRAKPHFGRRLLIALVEPGTPLHERRGAEASGFDDVLNECCGGRDLTARLLRGIRVRPELRCVLPPLLTRRAA